MVENFHSSSRLTNCYILLFWSEQRLCHFSCRDIKYPISLELEIELEIMADKFTQKIYAYPDGGVETIQLQNYFPRGTVNSTSVWWVCLPRNWYPENDGLIRSRTFYFVVWSLIRAWGIISVKPRLSWRGDRMWGNLLGNRASLMCGVECYALRMDDEDYLGYYNDPMYTASVCPKECDTSDLHLSAPFSSVHLFV